MKFEQICKQTQKGLKMALTTELNKVFGKPNVENDDGYLYARGEFPVLLVAHLDTVHQETPKKISWNKNIISSPQGIGGDDRCGIFIILNIIKDYKCSVVFCEDEEIGGIGAKKFAKAHPELQFNYIMEFDRIGKNDAVYYDCDNFEFEEFITKGGYYKTNFGTFSDISIIAPALKCAAVNLSCGYYNAHTKLEYIKWEEMIETIRQAKEILKRTDIEKDKYEYIEYVYSGTSSYFGHYDDLYDTNETWYITTPDGNIATESAISEYEAIGKFLFHNPTLTYYDIASVYSHDDLYGY